MIQDIVSCVLYLIHANTSLPSSCLSLLCFSWWNNSFDAFQNFYTYNIELFIGNALVMCINLSSTAQLVKLD